MSGLFGNQITPPDMAVEPPMRSSFSTTRVSRPEVAAVTAPGQATPAAHHQEIRQIIPLTHSTHEPPSSNDPGSQGAVVSLSTLRAGSGLRSQTIPFIPGDRENPKWEQTNRSSSDHEHVAHGDGTKVTHFPIGADHIEVLGIAVQFPRIGVGDAIGDLTGCTRH